VASRRREGTSPSPTLASGYDHRLSLQDPCPAGIPRDGKAYIPPPSTRIGAFRRYAQTRAIASLIFAPLIAPHPTTP